jgi:hypothetical protein
MQFPWSKNPVVVQVSYAKDIITYHQYRRDSSHRRQTARRAEAHSHTQSDGTCSLDSNTVEKSLGPETCRARVKMQPDTAVRILVRVIIAAIYKLGTTRRGG